MGPEYAHAEARKSPSLDGKVERDSQGKEIRYPVILNQYEKELANKVCNLFKVLDDGKTKCNRKQLNGNSSAKREGVHDLSFFFFIELTQALFLLPYHHLHYLPLCLDLPTLH